MSDKNKHSSTLQVIRGGQIVLHNLRMLSQVFQQLFLIAILIFSLIFGAWYFEYVDDYSRYITGEWMISKMRHALNMKSLRKFQMPDGSYIETTAYEVVSAPKVIEIKDDVVDRAERVLWIDLVVSLGIMSLISYLLRAYGKQKTQSMHVRGDRRGLAKDLRKWLIREKKDSPYTLGREKLPLVKYTEMQHILFSGSTGSGKSTGIRQLLDNIRARGEKVFIYDKGCSFVQDYFRKDYDVLLNPLDARSAHWDFWGECPTKAHFDNRAAALIPMPHNSSDPFWVNAARTIFSAAAYQMAKTSKNPSLLRLLRNLLTADIGELKALLAGTEAETLMSEKIEKTAVSIKSVLATYLKSLCFLTEGDESFSIRRWVEDDKQKNWVFVTSVGDKHESLKPLITAWLDIAINGLLSLTEHPDRRLWFILDEVTTLQQLPYLKPALAEARKFGGCFVIGLQNKALLESLYGSKGASGILGLLNTRLFFREPEAELAEWASINLGSAIIHEVKESISYGANTYRDGVSLNQNERSERLVTASEMMGLEPLHCFIRLTGNYPITEITFEYLNRPRHQEAFVSRLDSGNELMKEVVSLFEQLESPAFVQNTENDRTKSSSNDEPEKKVEKQIDI